MSLKPGEVLVLTVDVANLPAQKAAEVMRHVKEFNELAVHARENGNVVLVKSNRVQAEVLSYGPEDRVVAYVDIGNLPRQAAEKYLEHVREQLKESIPSDQTLVVAKGNKFEVQKA
jgi:hypothetical protein